MEQNRLVERSHTVELQIFSNTNSKINFGDNETLLDDKLVTAIGMLPSYLGSSPSGLTLMLDLNVAKGYLTIQDAQRKELNKQLPLEMFLRGESIIHFTPRKISVRNSYVDLPLINGVAIPAGPPPGLAIVFVFYYKDI